MSTYADVLRRTTTLAVNQLDGTSNQNSTNSIASTVRSESSSPPPLESIPASPMSYDAESTGNDEWIKHGLYSIVAAIDKLEANCAASNAATEGTTSDQSSTDGNLSVWMENTGTTDVCQALRALSYKRPCTYNQEDEEAEGSWRDTQNQRENKEQRENMQVSDAHPGPGWCITLDDEPFTFLQTNGTLTHAAYHKFHLANPKYPLISTTQGRGHDVYTTTLRPAPVPHARPYFTAQQRRLFSGREPFAEAVKWAITDQEDEPLLAALHAYQQWEQEVVHTQQQMNQLQLRLSFQKIKQMEWMGALQDADAFRRIEKSIRAHVPWGEREELALRQVFPLTQRQ